MSNFEMLDIDLRAITEDSKEFTLVLDDRYFEALDDAEIQHGLQRTRKSSLWCLMTDISKLLTMLKYSMER